MPKRQHPDELQRIHDEAMAAGILPIWVIYERPIDYPDGFVLRPQFVGRGMNEASPRAWRADTAAELRKLLPFGLVRIDRDPQDDPSIFEVWL